MKNNLLIVILVFLFSFVAPFSGADSIFNAESLRIGFDISSESEITGKGYIESATINLSFFPKDFEGQKVIKLSAEPKFSNEGKVLQFKYERPSSKIGFRVLSEVETYNTIPEIKSKVNFPLQDLDNELEIYTMPSRTIDSDDQDIIRLASEIVSGEDDLYAAVFKLGDWTKNNIEYDLSTLTADVSQKSSWVLKNRQGVCDELTSLFIAMLRSLGIPARFASGIAYTNSELFDERFGPHGWAEVYFPGYGWIPYDVTYGEFGWIDPGHVKFKDSVDPDESSTNYQWMGSKADLEPQDLNIETELLEQNGRANEPVSISVRFTKDSIKLGSYNLIIAEIENLNGFYYSTEASVVKPKEVEIINGKSRGIVLLPYEKKQIAWIARVDSNLDEKYSYTFPIAVATSNNITSKSDFVSSIREEYVSFGEIEEEFERINKQEEKEYEGNVLVECLPSKKEFYSFESASINCQIKNTGNVYLGNARICYEKECSSFELGISQEKEISFRINTSKLGARDEKVSLESDILDKDIQTSFFVNDAPKILVTEIIHPINVSYKQTSSLSFIVSRKSSSIPKDIGIKLNHNGNDKEWSVPDLNENRKYVVDFSGKDLRYGKNDYEIIIKWKDDLGNSYSTSEKFSINLNEASIVQRASLILNSFSSLSPMSLVVIFVIIGACFVLLIRWLFKDRSGNL